MSPTSAAAVGVRRTPRWARGWGKIVQWSMKGWSRKPHQGDLPMDWDENESPAFWVDCVCGAVLTPGGATLNKALLLLTQVK